MTGKCKHTIGTFFRRPFPHPVRWVVLVLLPLFVSLFMVVFQPFGLQLFEHEHKAWLLVGYGGVTLVVLAINMYLLPWTLPRVFRESHWSIGREMVYLTWMVLSISMGNYFYSVIFSIGRWAGLYGFLVFLGFTFAIGVVPILVLIIIAHNVMLRRNLARAGEVSRLIHDRAAHIENTSSVTIRSENDQHRLDFRLGQLLCIESEGNYIVICLAEKGRTIRHSLRNTMKNAEAQLDGHDEIFRCHRAFMVNLQQVEQVEGNSQGYRLKIRYLDQEVPVSRGYVRDFNAAFRQPAD